MVSPTDKPSPRLDAFLVAFRADIEAGCVRPLTEYLVRFPGDDIGIAREYANEIESFFAEERAQLVTPDR
jgi:hypothetical protein